MKNRQLRWMAKLLSATAVALVVSSAVGPAVCTAEQAAAQAAQAAKADDRPGALAAEEKRFWEQRVHLMDVLFPKSRGWTRFDQLPQALLDETPDRQRSVLIAMGLNLNGAGELGGWRREAKDFVGGLRRLDRKDGLIYSGQAPDREGEFSAVWPTYPSGKRSRPSTWWKIWCS